MSGELPSREEQLREDPPIYGQEWVVISLVNPPTDVLTKKNLHYINNFLVSDVNKMILAQGIQTIKYIKAENRKRLNQVLEQLEASNDDDDKRVCSILKNRFKEFDLNEDQYISECQRQYSLDEEEITDKYKIYLSENRGMLDKQFDDMYGNILSVRGLKIRGGHRRLEDAKAYAMKMRNEIEPGVCVQVAPMGVWLPVDFDNDEIQDQEYMLPALNELMHEYYDNIQQRNSVFNERKDNLVKHGTEQAKKNTANNLREKLRERKREKMREELEEAAANQTQTQTQIQTQQASIELLDKTGENIIISDKKDKKKKKRHKHRNNASSSSGSLVGLSDRQSSTEASDTIVSDLPMMNQEIS